MGFTTEEVKKQIEEGRTVLGIELGSTRIKAVLVGEDNTSIPIAAAQSSICSTVRSYENAV